MVSIAEIDGGQNHAQRAHQLVSFLRHSCSSCLNPCLRISSRGQSFRRGNLGEQGPFFATGLRVPESQRDKGSSRIVGSEHTELELEDFWMSFLDFLFDFAFKFLAA